MLRGYQNEHYRDKTSFALQAEYRFPLYWRFGGALFGALGQVAPSVNELGFQDIKLAGGGGLRFTLDQKQHLNLRLDYAFSPHGSCFYFGFGEAF